MNNDSAKVKVTIFGNEYSIKGHADEAYIQQLAAYVNEKISEITENTNLNNHLKISILAAINLADEVFRVRQLLKDKSEQSGEQLDLEEVSGVAPEAVHALIAHIDSELSDMNKS